MNLSLGLCLFGTLLHIPGIILRCAPFWAEIGKKKKILLPVCYSFILLINAIFYFFIYSSGIISVLSYRLAMIACIFCVSVVNLILIRNRWMEHIFMYGLMAIIIDMLVVIAYYSTSFFPIEAGREKFPMHAAVMTVAVFVLYPFTRKLFVETVSPFLGGGSQYYWREVYRIPLLIYIAVRLAFPIENSVNSLRQLVSRIFLGGAVLFICRITAYDQRMMRRREYMQKSLSMQKEYYRALSDNVKNARKLRHDLKHHIAAIITYAEEKKYEELLEYCREIEEIRELRSIIPYTGNSGVDGVIYHYMGLCEKAGISFEIKGKLENGGIHEVDVCALLGNLLDNAYTGSISDVSCSKKYVDIHMEIKDCILTMMVKNNYDGIVLLEKGKIMSKKGKGRTGIGLTSIRDICEKYDGYMKVEYTDSEFTVMTMMNIRFIP